MKKKFITTFVLVLFLLLFLWTMWYLYDKSKKKPKIFVTQKPFTTTIVLKTVAAGTISPRKEVAAKSQVSGVVDKLFVEAGEYVKKGDILARIKIIPNLANLNRAESEYNKAKIEFANAEKELTRQKSLYEQKLISELEYNGYLVSYNKAKEALTAGGNNLQIVKEGASKSVSSVSNVVKATADGMVLDVPVKEGTFVIESNTFNEGTTIANIADMTDLLFIGKVDESEVGKISDGMEIVLNIGGLIGEPIKANLEFISPKGITEDGAIKFEVKAGVKLRKGEFIRAGYSANADIVLDTHKDVMAIHESLLQFGTDSTFVEVETEKPQVFQKKLVKLGLSDGINVEILSGVTLTDKIKEPLKRK
jgi:HlyD family secretion protein